MFVLALSINASWAESAQNKPVTQGEFAHHLASMLQICKMGVAGCNSTLLAKLKITPGKANSWEEKAMLDKDFLPAIQMPFYEKLFSFARTLKVPAPPTLSAQTLMPPFGQQKITFSPSTIRTGSATQGELAQKIAGWLFGDKNITSASAVKQLSNAGIAPAGGWKPIAKIGDIHLVELQQAFNEIIKKVAEELKVPLSPTLKIDIIMTNE